MRLNSNNQKGFTLVEVTIILLVLVILSTIMLPQLGNFNRLARFVKAREDVAALCSMAKKMIDEVMLGAVYKDPKNRAEPVGLLVGPGDTPIKGTESKGTCTGCPQDQDLNWQLNATTVGHTMRTDNDGSQTDFAVGTIADHLQRNRPDPNNTNRKYKNPLENPQRWAAGAFFGWRGPYLDELTTDPWNNRYMINTFALYAIPNAQDPSGLYTSAVVCYSASLDGAIDTEINQPMNHNGGTPGSSNFGWQFGGDDIGAILSAGGPF